MTTNSQDVTLKLDNPPIIEAVLDIDCDMPPNFDLGVLETESQKVFSSDYPQLKKQFVQEHQIEARPNEPPVFSARQGLRALQFFKEDSFQLVQIRTNGFSFNRLRPYSSLDDYLPEIHRTWLLFLGLTKPLRIRRIVLRYINRILLPLADGSVELDDYFRVSPKLPDDDRLMFSGFLNQHSAAERGTGNQINIIMTSQQAENAQLPVIFDIEAIRTAQAEPEDWEFIHGTIMSLRSLKNRVFRNTLSDQCLKLFQH